MIKGLGNDIIEIARIAAAIEAHGQPFLDRLFTPTEQEYCLQHQQSARRFAGRFAAKEAIAKALGVGIGSTLNWLDMEVVNDERGRPMARFTVQARDLFDRPHVLISISHCDTYAAAVAIWS